MAYIHIYYIIHICIDNKCECATKSQLRTLIIYIYVYRTLYIVATACPAFLIYIYIYNVIECLLDVELCRDEILRTPRDYVMVLYYIGMYI